MLLNVLPQLFFGCALPQRVYVASFAYEDSANAGDAGGTQTFQKSAGTLMSSSGTVVAFFPPDACLNTSATPTNATTNAEYLQMSCGVLMTELERQAAAAGYDVVSWQMLRGGAPMDRARELGVDVLFEVNELSVNTQSLTRSALTEMNFYVQTDAETRDPLELSNVQVVGERCNAKYGQRPTAASTQAATLSVKMVSVKDGKLLWTYNRSVGQAVSDRAASYDVYFVVEAQRRPLAGLLYGVGFAGSFVTLAGAAQGYPEMAIPAGCVTCAALGGSWYLMQNRDYPTPEQVICAAEGTPRNPYLSAGPAPDSSERPAQQSGSSYSVSTSAGGTARDETDKKLIEAVVADFVKELGDLK